MKNLSSGLHDLSVAEAMTTDVVTLSACATMAEAANVFAAEEIDGAPVVDEAGHVVGVLSTTDFAKKEGLADQSGCLEFHSGEFELERTSKDKPFRIVHAAEDFVQQHMATALQTIGPQQSLHEAARYLQAQKIHRLIVIDGHNRAIGILTPTDILRALAKAAKPMHTASHQIVRQEVHHE